MTDAEIRDCIAAALGLSALPPLPLERHRVSLPNLAVAHLSVGTAQEGVLELALEKAPGRLQALLPRDTAVLGRVQAFLGAWRAVGMSGAALPGQVPAARGAVPAPPPATLPGSSAPAPPAVCNAPRRHLGGPGWPLGAPAGLEEHGTLIGLDHPMFRPRDEQPRLPPPQGPGDFGDPLEGVRRPQHLPPGALWGPARPDTRDPLGSRAEPFHP